MNIYTLNPLIESFINEKKLSGFSFKIQERWILQFKAFCGEHNIASEFDIAELMDGFCTYIPNESTVTKQNRQCLMRQLPFT